MTSHIPPPSRAAGRVIIPLGTQDWATSYTFSIVGGSRRIRDILRDRGILVRESIFSSVEAEYGYGARCYSRSLIYVLILLSRLDWSDLGKEALHYLPEIRNVPRVPCKADTSWASRRLARRADVYRTLCMRTKGAHDQASSSSHLGDGKCIPLLLCKSTRAHARMPSTDAKSGVALVLPLTKEQVRRTKRSTSSV
ncbi:hypothetical protein M011DRAFT_21119 [Sporormia fimetaria CBS 119925]|uniref:Uncharacterized protein n=1 Tax=Sporormia fimetaria CBS 119925 TaxID=1340428 RepID=A0A6A6VNU5_9PLEO|nr:hypothetical protein M011DRAFT_21119 [Sporormia fimetaria CBS 119925]